jgi:hypothetical protein
MTDQDGRPIEFRQHLRENVCITLGANHVGGRRRRAKARKIRSKGRNTHQAVLEIGSMPTPPMEGKNTWRSFAEHLGKHCAVNE